MKTHHLFIAILVCNILGTLISARSVKTILLLISAMVATYGVIMT